MGAHDTHSTYPAQRLTLREAFTYLQEEDRLENGHSPCSGTIGAANGCLPFPPSADDLHAAPLDVILTAITHGPSTPSGQAAASTLAQTHPHLTAHLSAAHAAWDDKWGPAVGFRHGDTFHFISIVAS